MNSSDAAPAHGQRRFARGALPALRWTAWLLALNLAWEVAQLPLYSFPSGTSWLSILFYVVHCTLGDAGIALGAYVAAAAITRDAAWVLRDTLAGIVVAVVVAVAYTAWSEWRNVYVDSNWAYAVSMPTIAGIGASPLLQWIVLLPVARWLLRRRLADLR